MPLVYIITHWKRLWCWEGLEAGGEGDDRGRDGWMASPTRWTWLWVNSRSWCWTGRPGMLQFMRSQRVRHDWVTELNWTELIHNKHSLKTPCVEWVGGIARGGYTTWTARQHNELSCFLLWNRGVLPYPTALGGSLQAFLWGACTHLTRPLANQGPDPTLHHPLNHQA